MYWLGIVLMLGAALLIGAVVVVSVLDMFSNEIPLVAWLNRRLCPAVCGILKWHNGNDGIRTFDGCSVHAKCSRCGKQVMQDSQGNWF